MFTGIVTALGQISNVERHEAGIGLRITPISGEIALAECVTGDSMSVSGVCLTMLNPDEGGFAADVSTETLAATTLGEKRKGDQVNLELAMVAGQRFGGHMVSGHVDAPVKLISRRAEGEAERLEFELPRDLARYVSRKGSVCLDGVSLTVNELFSGGFSVCVIPHTLKVTTLGTLAPGEEVNLEVDMIARYLERLVQEQKE